MGIGLSLGVTWEERPHPAGGWGTSLISIVSPEFSVRLEGGRVMRSRRAAAASNDNSAWRGAAFCLAVAGNGDEGVGLRQIGLGIRRAA